MDHHHPCLKDHRAFQVGHHPYQEDLQEGHSFQDVLGSVLPCLYVLDWVLRSLNEQDLVLPC